MNCRKKRSYTYTVVTPPTEEPITLQEAKDHLRLDWSDDDATVSSLIQAARQHCEELCGTLLTTVYDVYFDGFADEMELPRPPLQSVASVKYKLADGSLSTVDASTYEVSTAHKPGLVRLGYGKTWPSGVIIDHPESVVIRCTQGYTSRERIPRHLIQGMLLLIGHFDRNRESVTVASLSELPMGVHSLWFNSRVW